MSHDVENERLNQAKKIVVHVDPVIKDLIPDFLNAMKQQVVLIEEALKKSDYEAAKTLGHRMRGCGSSYGFDPITDGGKAIEEAAGARDAHEIRKRLNEIFLYLRRVEIK